MLSLLRHFMPEAAKTAKWPENRVFGLAAPPHSIFRPFSAVMIIIERIGLWRDGVNGAPTWQRAAICAHGEGGASTHGTREGRPRRTRSRRNACGLCRCWRRLRGTDRNGTPKACPPWRGLVGRKMIKNRFIGKVPVRKPPEKTRVLVCPARSSARMGPPELVGAELRAGKGCCRFRHRLSPGLFGTALNGKSKATTVRG